MNPHRYPELKPGMTIKPADLDARGLVKTTPPGRWGDGFRRTSSDTECPICHHKALEHPMCGRVLDENNGPFLNVMCSGERVKL